MCVLLLPIQRIKKDLTERRNMERTLTFVGSASSGLLLSPVAGIRQRLRPTSIGSALKTECVLK